MRLNLPASFRSQLLATLVLLAACPNARGDDLLTRLQSAAPEDRAAALIEIRTKRPVAALAETLVNLVRDPAPKVRREAAKTLGLVADRYNLAVRKSLSRADQDNAYPTGPDMDTWVAWQQSVADNLAKTAQDPDATVGREAARALALLSYPVSGIWDVGLACGCECDCDLRSKAYSSLSQVAKRTPDVVLSLLNDGRPQVIYNAAMILHLHTGARIEAVLRRFRSDVRPECRAIALRYLKPPSRDVGGWAGMLGDGDERVRYLAVCLLEDSDALLPVLCPRYRSASSPLRMSLVDLTFREQGKYGYVQDWALEDPDPQVRAHAIKVNVNGGVCLDEAYVARSMRDSQPIVRAAAIRAFESRHAEKAALVLTDMLSDPSESVRETDMELLSSYPTLETGKAMIAAFRRGKSRDGFYVLYACVKIGEENPAFLDALLTDPDVRIRAIGVSACAQASHPRWEQIRDAALRDPEPEISFTAATEIYPKMRAATLRELHKDPDMVVRTNVLAFLAKQGNESAQDEMEVLLRSEDPRQRESARKADRTELPPPRGVWP